MKLIRTTTEEFEFDPEEERKRLHKAFKGSQLKRQLAIFDAFLAKDIKKMKNLYDKLPRCRENECPEQEYVGSWITVFSGSDWGLKPVAFDRVIEIR